MTPEMKKLVFSTIIMVCILYARAYAASPAGLVGKANKLYKKQEYNDALKLYEQALAGQSDSTIINFNAGTAHYKTDGYQNAISSFEKSLATQDKDLESKANYNLGNSKYMLGLTKENSDLPGAVRLLEGALGNYNRTIQLTPKDEDAKVNYRIVEKKLKELKEKLKQQPQQKKNDQKQQQDKQQQGQGGTKQNQQEKQSGQEQHKQPQQQGEQENREQQARPQNKSGHQKKDQQAATRVGEPKEMSKEEADMLLEGYRQQETAAGMLRDKRKGAEEQVLKDW
jgi:Ca-activated chloride channel family protein